MSDLQVAQVAPTSEAPLKDLEASRGQLLVLVMDINPNQALFIKNPEFFLQCLDCLIVLANSHLMLHPNSRLAAVAAHSRSCSFLYPVPDKDAAKVPPPQSGQFEGFANVETSLRNSIRQILEKETESSSPVTTESLLSGALCMALSYINRQKTEDNAHSQARILVFSASGDTASQYMNFMNVFFSAQKMNIHVDTVMLEKDSGLLQQGADITGGFYHRISGRHTKSLLQFLLWMYLPDHQIRDGMSLPQAERVDYRAACFCHRQLVDVGFVCSVCLSIFCKFSPICTTCHAVFKAPGPIPGGRKRKSMK